MVASEFIMYALYIRGCDRAWRRGIKQVSELTSDNSYLKELLSSGVVNE